MVVPRASVVILASGDFPAHPTAIAALKQAEHIVCCDSAALTLFYSGLRDIEVIIGDLDSLPEWFCQRFKQQVIQVTEQESNDLAKALRYCISQNWTADVIILGATGRREDHTIGNIGQFADFSARFDRLQLWTDHGYFEAMRHSGNFSCRPGDQLSIFSMNPVVRITSRGLRYPLTELPLSSWWSGTLNECTGNTFSLQADGPSPILIYRPWNEYGQKIQHPDRRLPWTKIYFCGIGGVGMAGLAQLALDAGCRVEGSDSVPSYFTDLLSECGARIHIGQSPANLPADVELVVYSSAVSDQNCERQEALARGIPQLRRGAFLARIAACFRRVVAIAGSHGKTSVSAMLAHILRKNGLRAGYMVGGIPENFRRTAQAGDWDILVTEVDESDRTQELVMPALAVILNIDDDHSWAIGGTGALENSFRQLAEHSLHTLTWDTTELRRILGKASQITYLTDDQGPRITHRELPKLFGEHNRKNALMAVAAAELLGQPPQDAIAALADFDGVRRRQTLLGIFCGGQIALIEDYAHHPTELQATLEALRERFPDNSLVVVFQPHRPERVIRYGKRFGELLARYASRIYIVPTFQAWEEGAPEAHIRSIADAVSSNNGPECVILENSPKASAEKILTDCRGTSMPCTLAIIGAGDVTHIASELKKRLSEIILNP